jgi:hypothetical protein
MQILVPTTTSLLSRLALAALLFAAIATPASASVLYTFTAGTGDSFQAGLPAFVTSATVLAPSDLTSYTWTYFLPFLGVGLYPAGSGYFGGALDTQDVVGLRLDCGGGGLYCEGYTSFAAGSFGADGNYSSISYQGVPPGTPNSLTVATTPEPGTWALAFAGIAALVLTAKRRSTPPQHRSRSFIGV